MYCLEIVLKYIILALQQGTLNKINFWTYFQNISCKFAPNVHLPKKLTIQTARFILVFEPSEKKKTERKKTFTNLPVERESQPWSKSSPKGEQEFVLLACFPSIASSDW